MARNSKSSSHLEHVIQTFFLGSGAWGQGRTTEQTEGQSLHIPSIFPNGLYTFGADYLTSLQLSNRLQNLEHVCKTSNTLD